MVKDVSMEIDFDGRAKVLLTQGIGNSLTFVEMTEPQFRAAVKLFDAVVNGGLSQRADEFTFNIPENLE